MHIGINARIKNVEEDSGQKHTCDTFKGASGKFSFHFKEVCEKCIEYIGKFFIQIREISKILIKNVLEQIVWVISRSSLKIREVSHVC